MTISITPSASSQVRRMMDENDLVDHVVRIGVAAGGCSGYSYVLDIVDEVNDNDRTFEQHGVHIVCDPKSYLYLNGTEIDFVDSMMGGGFKFNNPNVKRSCGCGTSFSA
ncbi:MAG: iron-sulfur cluster assembly accessory protein [Myxococcota bacterium]